MRGRIARPMVLTPANLHSDVAADLSNLPSGRACCLWLSENFDDMDQVCLSCARSNAHKVVVDRHSVFARMAVVVPGL